MANDLVLLENQLTPLAPRFAEVLGTTMPPERLIRTIVVSVERLPKLLECDRQSLFNAAMSAACLGLEVDGVTGQAFLIPFKNKAQLVIGYKGYNTLAARSGYTIRAGVVRDGDVFDYDLAGAAVRHKPVLGGKGRIIASWALAVSNSLPPVLNVLSIDELMAIKAKSPGAKRDDSPWNDPNIGFPAMCEKSPKRRLARSMPLNIMQLAARLDEAVEEQGQSAHITSDRNIIIDGEFSERSPTPTAERLLSPSSQRPNSSAHGTQDAAGQPAPSNAVPPKASTPGAGEAQPYTKQEYVDEWDQRVRDASSAADGRTMHALWQSDAHKDIRAATFEPGEAMLAALRTRVSDKIAALREPS
jgi:recombination protein RecT